MSLLVYALAAPGRGAVRLSGIAGERLTTVPIGRVDAIVGAVTRAPRPTPRVLRQYERVIRSIWERRAAVLPVRFGTIVRDRAELETAVRDRQRTFSRDLVSVRNRAQMTVRVMGSGIGDPGSGGAKNARGRSRGRRYLEARRRAARLDHVPGVAAIRRTARRWVRAERIEAGAGAATVYHLVPRSSALRYRQAIERAAADLSLRLTVTGPWPPYAFAERW